MSHDHRCHCPHTYPYLPSFFLRMWWYISTMSKSLTDRDRAIIQQVILDRWNPLRLNKKITAYFGLTIDQVRYQRNKPAFKAEYAR